MGSTGKEEKEKEEKTKGKPKGGAKETNELAKGETDKTNNNEERGGSEGEYEDEASDASEYDGSEYDDGDSIASSQSDGDQSEQSSSESDFSRKEKQKGGAKGGLTGKHGAGTAAEKEKERENICEPRVGSAGCKRKHDEMMGGNKDSNDNFSRDKSGAKAAPGKHAANLKTGFDFFGFSAEEPDGADGARKVLRHRGDNVQPADPHISTGTGMHVENIVRDGLKVEVYRNLEGEFDPSQVFDKINEMRTVSVPCMLPEDEAEEREDKEMRRQAIEKGEFVEGYCPLCEYGDDGLSPHSREELKVIYGLDDAMYLHINDGKLRRIKVKEYNKNIYGRSVEIGAKNPPPKWSEYQVKYHDEHCNRRRFERPIWRHLEFLDMQLNFLRKNAIFYKSEIGNMQTAQIKINQSASLHWSRLLKDYMEHVKTLKALLDSRLPMTATTTTSAKLKTVVQQKPTSVSNIQHSSYFSER